MLIFKSLAHPETSAILFFMTLPGNSRDNPNQGMTMIIMIHNEVEEQERIRIKCDYIKA